ncbi:MAG TPA: histidine--tRNA ligase [Spirochaetota bacterium]|nr:histidine--tRNA ligase [Spirochaetota bacterium]
MGAIQRIKGTNDILPDHLGSEIFRSGLWRKLEETSFRIAGLSGYQEIRTPIFESTELFVRGLGDVTDIVKKEMFSFTDRGERQLTLRPEGTASIVRAWLENGIGVADPVARLSYSGPMFRAERPQKGRYRQFHQFGVECIGGPDVRHDIEVIALFWNILTALGVRGVKLLVNSVGCPGCIPHYRDVLRAHFMPHLGDLCEDCRERHQSNVLRMLDCKNQSCQEILSTAPAVTDHLCEVCARSWEGLQDGLGMAGIPWDHDPRLVRGLDYYTKTAFEIVHTAIGAQGTIVGGGRYDGLIAASGGPAVPAVGGAFGIERMLLAMQAEGVADPSPVRPRYFLVQIGDGVDEGMERLLHGLRAAGISVLRADGSRQMGKQMRAASKAGSQEAVFIGGDEWDSGKLAIKDLDSGNQEVIEPGSDGPLAALVRRAGTGNG